MHSAGADRRKFLFNIRGRATRDSRGEHYYAEWRARARPRRCITFIFLYQSTRNIYFLSNARKTALEIAAMMGESSKPKMELFPGMPFFVYPRSTLFLRSRRSNLNNRTAISRKKMSTGNWTFSRIVTRTHGRSTGINSETPPRSYESND